MTTATAITKTTRIERPADEVTKYLARPGIGARLTPPWAINGQPQLGSELATKIQSDGQAACVITEELRATPNPQLGHALAYRHATIRDDIELTAPYGNVRRLRIAIAGASGLIGRALTPFLQTQNHEIIPLKRDPATGHYDTAPLQGADVVINLAGASIAARSWTQEQRDSIWESRISAARTLIAAIEKLKHRPFAYLNASAVGYYGTRGNDLLDETASRSPAPRFLADVCSGWEHEAQAADALGVRTTLLRFGVVLSPAGGALATMLPFFQKNLGGKLGHGRQWTSWISIDDAIAAIYHAILTQTCAGPVNIASPTPLTNADFTTALSRTLGKKALADVPRWALRLRYGIDFANETFLASARLEPAKLLASGYHFRHPTLETALAHLL